MINHVINRLLVLKIFLNIQGHMAVVPTCSKINGYLTASLNNIHQTQDPDPHITVHHHVTVKTIKYVHTGIQMSNNLHKCTM